MLLPKMQALPDTKHGKSVWTAENKLYLILF